MIANVAHDLKTPLSSFLAGIEYIDQVINEVQAKQRLALAHPPSSTPGAIATHPYALSAGDVQDWISSITQCVTNMRNTNSFMLMTINRCIDYTKASKGLKLVPKFETIDLLETLSLPLRCMKDIQNRVNIQLLPIPKEICSHVITDKQWLQENVLCLLSNAVKYSNGGETTLSVLKHIAESNNHILNSVSGDSLVDVDRMELNSKVLNHSADDSQYVLRIEVEDHGISMNEDFMETLFANLKQTQRVAGGTGLGLFSLANRVMALEGKCGCMKRRDGQEGSLFWFTFPYKPYLPSNKTSPTSLALSKSRSPVSAVVRQPELTPDGANVGGRDSTPDIAQHIEGLNILLVDDSLIILRLTGMMLRKHNHIVHTASNGAEAVQLVESSLYSNGSRGKGGASNKVFPLLIRTRSDQSLPKNMFNVILMDLQMPVMDGFEAIRRIRMLDGQMCDASESGEKCCIGKHVIIGMSANSDANTAEEAYSAGADAFLMKPFDIEMFYRVYQEVLINRDIG